MPRKKKGCIIQAQHSLYNSGVRKYIPILEEIISEYPKEKEAHFWLGVYISAFVPPEMKDHNRGIKELETALEIDPDFAEGYVHLGNLYGRLGNFEKSLEYIERGASLDPEDPNAAASIANTYFK